MPQQAQNDLAKAVASPSSKPTKKISAPSKLAENGSASRNSAQPHKSFAFGSSTPRELSHIAKVARHSRLIDASNVEKKVSINDHNLSYYMRQARSITPGNAGGRSKCWAFGSSTPREFSHLNRLKAEQRVYDAKRPEDGARFPDSKSAITLSEKSAAVHKVEKRPKQKTNVEKEVHSRRVEKPSRLSDDAASEPDFVQDRENMDFRRDLLYPLGNMAEVQKEPDDSISNNSAKDNTSATKTTNPPVNTTSTAKAAAPPPISSTSKTEAAVTPIPETESKKGGGELELPSTTISINKDIDSSAGNAKSEQKLIVHNSFDIAKEEGQSNIIEDKKLSTENLSNVKVNNAIDKDKVNPTTNDSSTKDSGSESQQTKTPAMEHSNSEQVKEPTFDSSPVVTQAATNEVGNTTEAITSATKHETDEQPN